MEEQEKENKEKIKMVTDMKAKGKYCSLYISPLF
uniref:Uncharacterized protein n=1 Tax=Nelumbo nucifera TaxID=4432 RepID=A0A822YBS8_NELNU|nr:TPA_asm: hypothetical protein HUJ06_031518 [Nelumbo nucifera]